jgi:hypothetical protein
MGTGMVEQVEPENYRSHSKRCIDGLSRLT